MTEPKTEDPMVAALLRERAGYVQRGMDDRVVQVDEQLALRGYVDPADDESDQDPADDQQSGQTDARSTPPKRRRAPRKDAT